MRFKKASKPFEAEVKSILAELIDSSDRAGTRVLWIATAWVDANNPTDGVSTLVLTEALPDDSLNTMVRRGIAESLISLGEEILDSTSQVDPGDLQ